MPLLDHFRPPQEELFPWSSLHASWATRIADRLNESWLSEEYVAAEFVPAGGLEIDIAACEREAEDRQSGSGVATLPRRTTWTPPAAEHVLPLGLTENVEVRLYQRIGGLTLVGIIELISPANKDRSSKREAFVDKCAGYLRQGVSVVIIDVVTSRRANLHNSILERLDAPSETHLPDDMNLYASAYRPVVRDESELIDIWTSRCAVGEELPTMPLRLVHDNFVPVEFEATYQEACRRRRIG